MIDTDSSVHKHISGENIAAPTVYGLDDQWFIVKEMLPVDVFTDSSYFLCSSVTQLEERYNKVT